MNERELRRVVGHLEATEALAQLFRNLWFEQIRREVRDEKVRAYLMVFDDAFPSMNLVARFARRSAELLSTGSPDAARWSELRSEFAALAQSLLQGPLSEGGAVPVRAPEREPEPLADVSEDDLSDEEKVALESVDQRDIDSLFAASPAAAPAAAEQIDELFTGDGDQEAVEAEVTDEDVESFLHDEEKVEDDDLAALLEEESEETVDETELGAAEEEEELEDEIEDEVEEETEEELAEAEEVAETEEADLTDLLEEEEEDEEAAAGISDDEMAALLEEEETPPPKTAPKARPAKPKARPDGKTGTSGNGEETISEDEIDALFG